MKSISTLVLGATGSFAGGVIKELSRNNAVNQIGAIVRDEYKAIRLFKKNGIEDNRVNVIFGDALNLSDLQRAAKQVFQNSDDVKVIVHGVNYPYDQWVPNMENVTRNVIQVAEEYPNSLIVFPGNVYSLKPEYDRPLTEEQPIEPLPEKGKLRMKLENLLKESSSNVLIVRANDFFGPTVRNGLVDPVFEGVINHKRIVTCGNLDILHEWVYIPDLARATVQLVQATLSQWPNCEKYQVVHFKGYTHLTRREFASKAREVYTDGKCKEVTMTSIPWFVFKGMGFFAPLMSEIAEMRYLFDNTLILSDDRFKSMCPDFEPTPLDEALNETLDSYATN